MADLYLGGDFGDVTAAVAVVDNDGVARFAAYLRQRRRDRKPVARGGFYTHRFGSGIGRWADGFREEDCRPTDWLGTIRYMLRETEGVSILACIEKPYVSIKVGKGGARPGQHLSINPGQLRGIVAAGAMRQAVAGGLGVDASELLEVMKSTRSNPNWQTVPQRKADKVLSPILAAGAEPGGDHLSDAVRIALWCRSYGAHMRARRVS